MSSNQPNTGDESNSVPPRAAARERAGQVYGSPTPEEEIPPGTVQPGGTDELSQEELTTAEPQASPVDDSKEVPWEAPSTDTPLNDDNTEPVSGDRESFSSESDDDAAGA
ncbi:hypothetical protein CVV68_21965 [Arthrobacter livingstonensis]|uniref:Uncharacterized protein n=1 Tax=Arthrobacter livingstonensis TaxID=670078 RepID=A0A2V5L2U8_9MICC|nr:hypothetical protein [Arthrobacter livingstonensis]PYI64454.1 hypothetical protein CVV68_21965 [Arthrobacter livingstonensis]